MIRRTGKRWLRSRRRKLIDEAIVATVETAICNMEPVRREVLLLHRIERLSYAAIGERHSLSRAGVKAHIAEAVAEFAGALAVPEDRPEGKPGECL
jgi:DNA-directed RNA polymerase specialized sigma24 family protein